MHLNAKLPVLMPRELWGTVEKQMSKAALMDMVWSLASQTCESAEDHEEVAKRIQAEWSIVKTYRE